MDFLNFLIFNKKIPLYPKHISKLEDLEFLSDRHIVKAVDKKYRPLVTISFVLNNEEVITNTFYKRYRIFFEIWVGLEDNIFDTSAGISNHQFTLLKNIINNKVIQIQEYHYPRSEEYIGKYICNRRVWDAAMIIQKTWRKYLFNNKKND